MSFSSRLYNSTTTFSPLAGNQDACTSGTTRGWMQGKSGPVDLGPPQMVPSWISILVGFPGFGCLIQGHNLQPWMTFLGTLGTNISKPKGSWEDEFPFQLVGYVWICWFPGGVSLNQYLPSKVSKPTNIHHVMT